jgi:hypothetical protein
MSRFFERHRAVAIMFVGAVSVAGVIAVDMLKSLIGLN